MHFNNKLKSEDLKKNNTIITEFLHLVYDFFKLFTFFVTSDCKNITFIAPILIPHGPYDKEFYNSFNLFSNKTLQ